MAAIAAACGLQPPAIGQPPAPRVEEVKPELFYLEDDAGGLVPVPGFRYEDFVEMLRLKEGLPRGPQPPPAVIASAAFEGETDGNECLATVRLKVVQSEAGWVGVPLALGGFRLTDPPVHEGKGRFLIDAENDRQGGYRGWFEGRVGDEHVLTLRGVVRVDRSKEQEAVSVDLPRATASRISVRTAIEQPIVVVDPPRVEPRVERVDGEAAAARRTDERNGEAPPRRKDGPGSLVTLVGVAGPTRILMRSPGSVAPESGAAPQAVGEIAVRIDGRRAVSDVALELGGLPAGMRTVTVRLPARAGIVAVRAPSTLVEARGGEAGPEAVFAVDRGTNGEASLRFECETPVEDGKVESLAYGVAGIADWRQWGRISILVDGDWQVGWGPVPANRRVDPPASLDSGKCIGAFAYDAQPARLPLQVKPLGSRVVIEPEYGYSVGGNRIELDARLRITVRGRPITEIELALDGWGIDGVGPSNLVDADGIAGTAGRLTIPFVKPLTGNGTVEIQAARVIARTDERVAWTLPVPKANLVGPASVTIVSDSDIELVPDGDGIRGLVRQASSGRGNDAAAISYRLEGTQGAFAATRRFLPRRIDAMISAHALVDRSDTVMDETIRYDVAHVPLGTVSLAVPRAIHESGGLEVRHHDMLLNLRESPEPSSEPPAGDAEPSPAGVVKLLAELPSPRLGSVELKLRYSLKTPDVPAEATVAEDLPIVTPLEGKIARQSFSVESQGGLAVDVRGDQWKRDASIPGIASSRSWTSTRPQEFVPLALAAERQTAVASSIVEAAWLETRILPDRREDLFRYRIESASPTIQLTLPGEPAADAVEVRLDGRSVVGGIQPGGRVVVELPAGGGLGEHLLEIERKQARPSLFEPLVLEAPQFGDRTQQRRFYWEVRLETDEHVVVPPRRWTSQQGWGWSGLGFVRRPVVSRESLARWVNARLEEEVSVEDERSMPTLVGRRDVYSGIGWPGSESIWIVPTWLLVACVSGPVLLGGLAVVYRPSGRLVPLAVALGAAWSAVTIAAPDLAPLAVQYALPGLALTVMAAGLRMAVAPRAARAVEAGSSRVIISGSSTRTVALPSLLIGAGSSVTGKRIVETLLLAAILGGGGGSIANAEEPLRFLRVRVPDGKAASGMLGDARYVPMPLAKFEEAVARAGQPAAGPGRGERPLSRVAYRLSWQPGRRITGFVEFEVGRDFERYPFVVPVGGLRIEAATVETEEGTGVATVAGLSDGRLGVFVRQPGRYRCRGSAPAVGRSAVREQPSAGSAPRAESIELPLVPAITTTIDLEVAEGFRPVVEGGLATVERDDDADPAGRRYRIMPRAVDSLSIRFEPGSAVVPLEVENRLSVAHRQWSLEAVVAPLRPWQDEALTLRLDPGLSVTSVALRPSGAVEGGPLLWSAAADGRGIRVLLPPGQGGGRAPVVVSAVAPLDRSKPAGVPIVRPLPDAWASGRAIVSLDESTTFKSVEVENAAVVATPEPFAGPLPQISVELQSVDGAARVEVADRAAEIDTARVTTVDISSGAVTARAMVNVRVGRGEVFAVKARIGPEWLVDAVEIPGESAPLEWGVEAASPGSVLRVGLVRGIAPGRELTLRVVGHRAVLPQGRPFPASSLDMVRFDGESKGQALVDVRTNAETTILVAGVAEAPRDAEAVPQRMRGLLEPGATRARVPAGERARAGEITILRRRPPVDVQTRIHVTSREERLTESFTFECSPRDSEIDSLVVFLSESAETPPEWSVLAPSSSKVSARRIEVEPRREQADAGQSLAAESWLVEIAPPAREPVSIRATRTLPFSAPRRVSLAWVEGAPTRGGEILVRDAGRGRPIVTATRLPEVPGRAASSDRVGMPLAAFTFDAARDLAAGGPPALELSPATESSANARAWVWSETTTSWCDESGSTEYETSFVIENHGRSGVTIDLPPDKRLEGVLVDGARLQAMGSDAGGGQLSIELPSGRRFVRLDLRMVSESRPTWGCWTVNAAAGRVDLPVMERSWLLGLPPQLEIAMASTRHRLTDARVPSWRGRLLGIPASREQAPYVLHRFVPIDGGAEEASVTLVRSTAVSRATVAVAAIGLGAGWWLSRRRLTAIWLVSLACGMAVLWSAAPWYALARSLVSGLLAGGVIRVAGRRGAAVGAAAVLAAASAASAAEPRTADRVFITPGDSGPIALVPETVFRAIAAADRGPAGRAVGVVRTRLEVRGDHAAADAAWGLEAELEGEAGGRIVIEQPENGSRFVAGTASLDGKPLADAVSADGRSITVVLDGFGRRTLRAAIRPVFESAGGIDEAVLALPVAARSTVTMPADWVSGGGTPHECEWSGSGSAADRRWSFADRASDEGVDPVAFDVTGGAAVRVSRAKRRGVSIVRRPVSVSCLQEIDWGERECIVRVSIEAKASTGGAEDRICRSLFLDVDPRLVPIGEGGSPDEAFVVRKDSLGHAWIEWTKPDASPQTASLAFRMPFPSPVGIFEVPLVRPFGNFESTLDVRLRTTAPGLRVAADLPASTRPIPPRGDDVVGRYVGWSTRAVGERVSIGVSRRETPLPIEQSLSVAVERDRARLLLDARVGAAGSALAELDVEVPAGCIVDAFSLTAVDPPADGSADARPLDVGFFREKPDRLRIVVQRPLEGGHRLSLEARLPGAVSNSIRLPVARILAVGADPVEIVVSAPEDRLLSVGGGKEFVAQAAISLPSDAPAPLLNLVERRRPEGGDAVAADAGKETDAATVDAEQAGDAAAASAAPSSRVEIADVRLAIDDRGRSWGVVRFELMTGQPLVRLRLPAGFRLFDVFVDEHPATTRPAEDGGWEVRLLDVSRPRSLVAVFLGELGERVASGDAIELAPPEIESMPAAEVLWTVRGPRGRAIRFLAASGESSVHGLVAARARALDRLTADVVRAFEGRNPEEQAKIRTYLDRDGSSDSVAAEAAWDRSSLALAPSAFFVTAGKESSIRFRIARLRDPTLPGRIVGTLCLAAAVGVAWRWGRGNRPAAA